MRVTNDIVCPRWVFVASFVAASSTNDMNLSDGCKGAPVVGGGASSTPRLESTWFQKFNLTKEKAGFQSEPGFLIVYPVPYTMADGAKLPLMCGEDVMCAKAHGKGGGWCRKSTSA